MSPLNESKAITNRPRKTYSNERPEWNGRFTPEDEQIVWADKSSQTDKSSDVKTGRTNFQTTSSSEFVRQFVRL